MQIIIDMDGTICSEEKTYSRSLAIPLEGAVKNINDLYNKGHTILIYSARSWQEFEMTTDWLNRYKVKYHQLILGKPIGDVWIDDRALNFGNWETVRAELDGKGYYE
jgi:hypothetical protein